jgi:ATP-dependent 26S proteasome regulatory subunit
VEFPLPDLQMREQIMDIAISEIEGTFDSKEIASLTEGYSGSDLRMVVREAVLNALMTDRTKLDQKDMIHAVGEFNKRMALKYTSENEQ